MGAGFWAGFGEQFSDTVEENRKYIRKASDDRRTYLKTRGASALASNKKQIKKMEEYVSYFTMRGIPKRSVQGLLEKGGYAGVKNFYSMLNDRPELSTAELSEIIDKTSSYASELDIDPITIMQRAFNTVKAGEADPVVRKNSILQALIGNDPYWQERVDAQYPELTSAIANEGNVPTGLGGINLQLPPERLNATTATSAATALLGDAERSFDTELNTANRASMYTGEDFPTHPKYGNQTRARAYARSLENLKSLSTDVFLTEYSEIDQSVLINAALREKQFPGQITDNPNLIKFGAHLKLTIANAKVFDSPEAYARSEFRNVVGYYMIAGNLKYNPGSR
tara:strand:- start:3376 stop:4395 length:1020 start_codon:yes stop_codon:yes gene_type:complete